MDSLPPVLYYVAGFLALVLFAYQVFKSLSGQGARRAYRPVALYPRHPTGVLPAHRRVRRVVGQPGRPEGRPMTTALLILLCVASMLLRHEARERVYNA